MEDDRAQVDLGIAADLEENQVPENVVKQPKKRFVGKRAATSAAAKAGSTNSSIEESGAIQGKISPTRLSHSPPQDHTTNTHQSPNPAEPPECSTKSPPKSSTTQP